MSIKLELKDSFHGQDFFSEPIVVKHEVEWESDDLSWDEHMANFLTFLSMTGYIIEHSWIEKLQDTAQELYNPPMLVPIKNPKRVVAKKRSKK